MIARNTAAAALPAAISAILASDWSGGSQTGAGTGLPCSVSVTDAAGWADQGCRRQHGQRTVQFVGVQTRSAGIAYPVIVLGYAVLAVSVVASLAVGLGVVAARVAGPGAVFAVALGTTTVTGLFGGLLVAPALFRRVRR